MDHRQQIVDATNADELIIIETTEPTEQYKVSKHVLCQVSDYFVKALDGGFSEASEKKLELPGTNAHTVRLFVYWVSQRKVPPLAEGLNDDPTDMGADELVRAATKRHRILADLWMLGDLIISKELQGCAMREIFAMMELFWTPPEATAYAFKVGAGTRLASVYVQQAQHEYFHEASSTHKELTKLLQSLGFARALMEGRGTREGECS